MRVLHIRSSARTDNSNSRAIGNYLIEQLNSRTTTRDLANSPLSPISAEDLVDLHASNNVDRNSLQQHLTTSNQLIDELKSADTLVIEAPLYNFSVPVVLKQWIDMVCRAGNTFRYTADGPEGLTNIRQAYIIVTTGGTLVGSPMDFASEYLAHICRFIGVTNIAIIDGSGSKREPQQVVDDATAQIDQYLQTTVANV
ncbi:FMN-dependent NADH-azoreductase [BD1-7 clade bacterium]|uniref:FMN dependent NADH:quinone oxidoreductase n=1 Tax=BD1-7 clade bacterium TaxID=2029982 RepID=A0A5S9Q4Q7_9GAMM|nr:FMN-dependent NADH-azoreductase [BD1-7 clade bacterium]